MALEAAGGFAIPVQADVLDRSQIRDALGCAAESLGRVDVLINTIGTLVDPPATAVNAIGDNVASMMVARILGGKRWLGADRERRSSQGEVHSS